MSKRRIILNEENYTVLRKLVEARQKGAQRNLPHIQRLAEELKDAVVMDSYAIPGNIITIGSRVRYRLIGTGDLHHVVLGFPADVKDANDSVSILTPLGLALIGEREGTEVEYVAPGGTFRLLIEKVEHLQTA